MNRKILLLPAVLSYLYGCGQTTPQSPPVASHYTPTVQPRAAYEMKCEDQQVQQKDIEFQQQNENCTPELQFVDSKLVDFKVDLDCEEQEVVVQTQSQKAVLPVQSDGNFHGQLNFQQPVQQDAKGNMQCFVDGRAVLKGQATCDSAVNQGLSLTTQVKFGQQEQPCQFAAPLFVEEDKLTIRIPEKAKDLGCQAFGPQPFEVKPGTWVSWINKDSEEHSIVSDSGEWETEKIAAGDHFTVNLPKPGIYTYHSEQHPSMRGMIVVEPAPGPSPSPEPSLVPSPEPSPGIICVVEKQCPVVAKIDYTCSPPRR